MNRWWISWNTTEPAPTEWPLPPGILGVWSLDGVPLEAPPAETIRVGKVRRRALVEAVTAYGAIGLLWHAWPSTCDHMNQIVFQQRVQTWVPNTYPQPDWAKEQGRAWLTSTT